MHDLLHLHGKDALTLAHALKDLSKGEPMNDRDLLLEHGVSMLQKLPSNSGLSHAISDGFIGVSRRVMKKQAFECADLAFGTDAMERPSSSYV